MGLRVYLVAERTVDEALAAYLNGTLKATSAGFTGIE